MFLYTEPMATKNTDRTQKLKATGKFPKITQKWKLKYGTLFLTYIERNTFLTSNLPSAKTDAREVDFPELFP
jgi:hypothetical protein